MDHEERRAAVQRFVAVSDHVRRLVGAGPFVSAEDAKAAFDELEAATAEWRRSLGLERD